MFDIEFSIGRDEVLRFDKSDARGAHERARYSVADAL